MSSPRCGTGSTSRPRHIAIPGRCRSTRSTSATRTSIPKTLGTASSRGCGATIRERAIRILEGLPRGEVFDWVDRVSIELTTQMLSTLFDFPFEERRTLTRWSNVSTVNTRAGTEIDSEEKRDAVLQEMLAYFAEVWKVRQKQPPKFDLI